MVILINLALPKAVEIAIGINLKWLIAINKREICLWLFAWFEEDELSASFAMKIDPLDIVVLKHWMDDFANFDMDEVAITLCNWDVLLHRCLDRAR